MIVVTSKIQIRRGTELELPGAPISDNPLTFSDCLDVGEIAFTVDNGRMFIGPDKTVGNANFQRSTYPYQNIEILTELSSTNKTLFNRNIKNQDRDSFYVPTIIRYLAGDPPQPLSYSEYTGGISVPTKFFGEKISATVEYHAFDINSNPIQQGIIRIMCNKDNQQVYTADAIGSGLVFTISEYDSVQGCYSLYVKNTVGVDISVFVRIVSIIGPKI